MSTLNIRGLSPGVKERAERACQLRGITYAEYLKRLVELHQEMLVAEFKFASDKFCVSSLLVDHGLEPVREVE